MTSSHINNAFVAAFVARLLAGADKFNREVIDLPIPETPKLLSTQRGKFAIGALQEELTEFSEALVDKDILEASDALIDLIYFAIGRLVEMGVPAGLVFDEVQRANMDKERGELSKRANSLGYDAVKPKGWKAPDHSALLTFDKSAVERAAQFEAMSPILKKAVALRAKKGNDYNSGPTLHDYFPFGHLSYAQMLHVKMLRIHSLLAVIAKGGKPNFEGISDTLEDLINYISFYAEAIADGSADQPTYGAIAK